MRSLIYIYVPCKQLQLHATASIRSEVHDAQRETKEEMKQFVRQLVTRDVQSMMYDGLGGEEYGHSARLGAEGKVARGEADVDTGVALGKFALARKEKERELRQLTDRC